MPLSKEEQKIANRRHYLANKEKINARTKARKAARQKVLIDIKKELVCEECGEDRYQVLEFHHINPAEKLFTIGNYSKAGFTYDELLEEISKCKVLCANCHRMLHWELKQD